MDNDKITETNYLQELYKNTQGNPETQVSMYDIGIAIGIDKSEVGKIAEELIVQGYIELQTLAGGISITSDGLSFLGFSATSDDKEAEEYILSAGPLVNDGDRAIIVKIITNIQREFASLGPDYSLAEQIVLDLKAVDIHFMSPAPKTAVITALFRSLADCFKNNEEIVHATGLAHLLRP